MLQQEIKSYIFKITFYSRGVGPGYEAIVEMCHSYEISVFTSNCYINKAYIL